MISKTIIPFRKNGKIDESALSRPMHYLSPQAEKKMRIVDFNNFFSFQGGGIKNYLLRKVEYYSSIEEVEYSLIVPSDSDRIERFGTSLLYHIKAPRMPFAPAYRTILNVFKLKKTLQALNPDIIEAGGPYIDPYMLQYAAKGLNASIVGFWHTDYPTAYFEFYGNMISPKLGGWLKDLGWKIARNTYGKYEATFAAADCVVEQLQKNGIEKLMQCVLGIDTEQFNPKKYDEKLRRDVGATDRPLILFPHRFLREKGILEVMQAVPVIAAETGAVFAFAGNGPHQEAIEEMANRRKDCFYLGYIKSPDRLARWYASSDLVLGLSAWETFGLSVIEAMASGVAIIGADKGATNDWIMRSGAGVTIPHGNTRELIRATIDTLQNPDLKAMGKKGREFVTQFFSWQATFERQFKLYRDIISAKRKQKPLGDFPMLLPNKAVDYR